MSKRCHAVNSTPHTNMRTGHMFWKNAPCTEPRMPSSNYCSWHQDHQQRDDAMRAALAPVLVAALNSKRPQI